MTLITGLDVDHRGKSGTGDLIVEGLVRHICWLKNGTGNNILELKGNKKT